MNHYDSATRGTFQNVELAKQLVSFEGFKLSGRNGIPNVTPTDIDGFVQLDSEECFIFFELKHSGGAPVGQASALQKACDFIENGGGNSVLVIAEHKTPFPETIIAKDAIVKKIYYQHKWWNEREGRTLYEVVCKYIAGIKKFRSDREESGMLERR